MDRMCEHANGLWEQEHSQDMRRGPRSVQRKTSVLCRGATGGRLNFVLMMTRIKPQKCGKHFRTPSSSSSCPSTFKLSFRLFSSSSLEPLSMSILSISTLNLLMFCFFSSPQRYCCSSPLSTHSSTPPDTLKSWKSLSPNAWNQPTGASDSERSWETTSWLQNKHRNNPLIKQQSSFWLIFHNWA